MSHGPLLYVPVAGTMGVNADPPARTWWTNASPWMACMTAQGFSPVDEADPFYWSTDLSRRAWIAGGFALGWYCQAKRAAFGGQPLRLVCHSFGLNVVAYAAYFGLEIDTLIAVSPPYRKTMDLQLAALRFRTKRWLTIHAREWDRTAVLGGLGDGAFTRYPPDFACDRHDTVPGIGHSAILYEPAWFHWWVDNGWTELLKSEDWGKPA